MSDDEWFEDRSDHSTMNASEYQEEITFLTARHLYHHDLSAMDPLLKALGCRKVQVSGRQCYVQRPKVPPDGSEDLIRKTLIEALSRHAVSANLDDLVGFSILDGLAANQRWRACLDSEESSHFLAANLISFFAGIDDLISRDVNHGSLGLVLLPGPLAILNDWTAPATPHQEIPSVEEVVCALFGDAWYHLVAGQPGVPQWSIPDIVRVQRPPFLQGLMPLATSEPVDLPVLNPENPCAA